MQSNLRQIRALTLILLVVGWPAYASGLREQCAEAKKKGIEFLSANQQSDGKFPTERWVTTNPENKTTFDTPFTAAQVLYSLSFCNDAKAREVQQLAAQYILSQQEPPGVWRYPGRGGKYSPDIDDTSLEWSALKRSGQSTIPPEALRAVRESKNEAGLFTTWIGDPATWFGLNKADLEIDSVVNINALLLFGLVSEDVEMVCNYVLSEVESDGFLRETVYYSSPLAFTLAFSRAYADGSARCLERGVSKIRTAALKLQQEDGGWALNAVYRGAKVPVRFGSRAHTTALCVEALAKYLNR